MHLDRSKGAADLEFTWKNQSTEHLAVIQKEGEGVLSHCRVLALHAPGHEFNPQHPPKKDICEGEMKENSRNKGKQNNNNKKNYTHHNVLVRCPYAELVDVTVCPEPGDSLQGPVL
jgi:hypothetical protein